MLNCYPGTQKALKPMPLFLWGNFAIFCISASFPLISKIFFPIFLSLLSLPLQSNHELLVTIFHSSPFLISIIWSYGPHTIELRGPCDVAFFPFCWLMPGNKNTNIFQNNHRYSFHTCCSRRFIHVNIHPNLCFCGTHSHSFLCHSGA